MTTPTAHITPQQRGRKKVSAKVLKIMSTRPRNNISSAHLNLEVALDSLWKKYIPGLQLCEAQDFETFFVSLFGSEGAPPSLVNDGDFRAAFTFPNDIPALGGSMCKPQGMPRVQAELTLPELIPTQ